MSKKGIVTIDLATMVGTLKLVMPTDELPRQNKKELELKIAGHLLKILQERSSDSFTNWRNNADDPPDVLLEHNGKVVGIELTELLPPNRLEKDAIIRSLRKQILSELQIGPKTRNQVVRISFADDYAASIHLRNATRPLAALLNSYFYTATDQPKSRLPVPRELVGVISNVAVEVEDLSGDPRIENEDHPLIVFGAQHTLIVPEDDIPVILDSALGPKLLHDLSVPTWLLLWSGAHSAISSVRDDITLSLCPISFS